MEQKQPKPSWSETPTRIKEVVGMTNKGEYALVEVITNKGDVASVWVGGDCEVYFDKGLIKCFVKKAVDKQ